MPYAKCKTCNKDFYCKPNRIKKGWGKYCSNTCKHKGFYTGIQTVCITCNKSIYKTKTEVSRSKSGKYFCSKSCQTIWRNSTLYIGDRHSNWVNGNASYRKILLREKIPHHCVRCRLNDERILAVHHKDKDHKNNEPSNLMWLCHNCHYLIHHDKSEATGYID